MNYEILKKLEAQVWVLRKIAPYDDELEKLKSKIYEIRDRIINQNKENINADLDTLKNKALKLEENFYAVFNYRQAIIDNQIELLSDLPLKHTFLEPFDYQIKEEQAPRVLYEEFVLNTGDKKAAIYENFDANSKYYSDVKKWFEKFNKKLSKIDEMDKAEVRKLIEELRSFEASMYREGYYLEEFEEEIYNIRNILNSKLTIPKSMKKENKKSNFEDEDSFIKVNNAPSLSEEPKIIHKAYNVSQIDYTTPQVDRFYDKLKK